MKWALFVLMYVDATVCVLTDVMGRGVGTTPLPPKPLDPVTK